MTSRIAFAPWLSVVLTLSPIAWADPDVIEFPEGKTEVKIPLMRAADHLLLPVRVNGREPVLFMLDTGCTATIVAEDYARALETSVLKELAPDNGRLQCVIEQLEVGGVKQFKTFGATFDMADLRNFSGVKQIQGILGGKFLRNMPFTVNWSQCSLTLYKQAPTLPADAVRTPIWPLNDVPALRLSLKPGIEGPFIVDTGAGGAIGLQSAVARRNFDWLGQLPSHRAIALGANGLGVNRAAQFANIEVAGILFPTCELCYAPQFERDEQGPEPAFGKIGLDILSKLEMTFDYQAKLAWIRRDPNNGIPAEWGDPQFDPSSTDAAGVTALIRAAGMGRAADVKRFLATGAPADAKDAQGHTALFHACGLTDSEIARALITAGASVNSTASLGRTPLHNAAQRGNREIVVLLLEHGAKINAEDDMGGTPLTYAADAGCIEVVRLLIKAGADLNVVGPGWGSALNNAALYGRTEVAKLLLEAGADVTRTDRFKTSMLFPAATGGSAELVSLLLARGLDVDSQTSGGQTPVMAAARYGHADIVRLLLDHGAHTAIKDKLNHTALEYALMTNNLDCARILYFTSVSATSKPAATGG